MCITKHPVLKLAEQGVIINKYTFIENLLAKLLFLSYNMVGG